MDNRSGMTLESAKLVANVISGGTAVLVVVVVCLLFLRERQSGRCTIIAIPLFLCIPSAFALATLLPASYYTK
jgi:multidrug efflux pump subunit AcrB